MTAPVTESSRLLRACRGEPVDRPPVWFMRQAGRYMAEYRALRAKHTMLELCREPDLAAEVTLQPIAALEVDAAILFSDILLPFPAMGLDLDYVEGRGPVIANPVRSPADVDRLRPVDIDEAMGYVAQATRNVVGHLNGRVPLIGFAGAPFTLASYAIEGGSARHHLRTKRFMYEEPEAWQRLLARFADIAAALLEAQVAAGAQVVQLFDSWAGQLSPADYREYVFAHSQSVLARLGASGVPRIHFGVETNGMLDLIRDAGADVVGLDWRIPLDRGWDIVGPEVGVQGNLDPAVLFAPPSVIGHHVDDILRRADRRPGHIFNLGHGILPETPVDHVRYVVERIHRWADQPAAS